jgi:hypothetical protein
MTNKKTLSISFLLIGALASLSLMLYTGRNNNSVILMGLFSIWVLSPFVFLFWANKVSNRWAIFVRMPLENLMLIIASGSLLAYAVAFFTSSKTPAFIFLLIPFLSWLLLLVSFVIAYKKTKQL